jgi:hypothetical protein
VAGFGSTDRDGGEGVATAKCSAITKGGKRCRLDATHGSYCYQHAPETAEERRRNARRGGKRGGNGRGGVTEVTQIKREIRTVIGGVLSGQVGRPVGAVAFQGFNTLLKAVQVERRAKETEEILERIEQLEAMQEGGHRSAWHR